MNSSKGLLTIIAVVLIGIFIVIAMQYHRENRSPIEKISDGISETSQERHPPRAQAGPELVSFLIFSSFVRDEFN